MEHIIEVLENGILLYCILLKIGSPKSQIRFKIGYPMAIGIYSLVFIILRDPLYLTFLMEIVLYLVLPCILLKNISRSLIIYISLTIVGITTLVGSITVAFSNICSFGTLFPKITFTIVNSFVIIAIILAVYNKKILTYFYDLYNVSKNVKIIIMIFIWELVLLVSTQAAFLRMDLSVKISVLTGIVLILILLGSCIIVHLLITNEIKKIYYQKINKTLGEAMVEEIKHYEQLNQSYEQTRRFRHDFNNIIIGLRSILHQNDIEGALQYLNRCTRFFDDTATLVQTGHPIVNSLLTDKIRSAKKNCISIIFDGHIAYDVMDPIDLCVVFGNVVDNAIEACQKLPNEQEKEICISARVIKDVFFIKSTNPTKKDIEISNIIMTTKEDATDHGIGLYNIRSIVQKYDGHMQLNCANQIFTIELDFIIPANRM